jgi:ferredoxin
MSREHIACIDACSFEVPAFTLWCYHVQQRAAEPQAKMSRPPPPPAKEEEDTVEEDEDEHGDTYCGSCGGNYTADEFWIGCDICEKWYHGKCVKITPARAEHIKQYKCPSCSNKRARM